MFFPGMMYKNSGILAGSIYPNTNLHHNLVFREQSYKNHPYVWWGQLAPNPSFHAPVTGKQRSSSTHPIQSFQYILVRTIKTGNKAQVLNPVVEPGGIESQWEGQTTFVSKLANWQASKDDDHQILVEFPSFPNWGSPQ